jgi:hypothetical protein
MTPGFLLRDNTHPERMPKRSHVAPPVGRFDDMTGLVSGNHSDQAQQKPPSSRLGSRSTVS